MLQHNCKGTQPLQHYNLFPHGKRNLTTLIFPIVLFIYLFILLKWNVNQSANSRQISVAELGISLLKMQAVALCLLKHAKEQALPQNYSLGCFGRLCTTESAKCVMIPGITHSVKGADSADMSDRV